MTALCELAKRYRTDKGPWGFDGEASPGHGYTTTYDALFRSMRHDGVVLMEIGIAKGASLLMWSEYFTEATIIGLDISLAAVDRAQLLGTQGGGWEQLPRHSEIQLYEGSQDNVPLLRQIVEEHGGVLDIVIDDGSHRAEHQLLTLETLFPYLTPGGYYVIEDIGHGDAVSGNVITSRMLDAQGLWADVDEVYWAVRQRTSQSVILRKKVCT